MKYFLLRFIEKMALILSLLINDKVLNITQYFKKKVYWYAYKKNFKQIGKNSYMEYPFQLKGLKYVEIGNNFQTASNMILEAWDKHNGISFLPKIKIGDNVCIASNCHIGCINSIIIEDGVLIGGKVFITDHFHGDTDSNNLLIPPNERFLTSKGSVHIKKNVWIGENVSIMPGVTIGEGSIIGANSVVTKNIPDYCIAVGVPASVIKRLF